jgi:UDP-N-acetylglucosamine 2-epimerase
MSKIFFENLEIPESYYHFDIPSQSHIQQTADIMRYMEDVLKLEKPDCTVVYGVVNSTLASALESAKLKVPVVHIEGGVRGEGYLLKKPVIVITDLTWFPEILQAGWKVIVDDDRGKLAEAIENFEPPREHPQIFGDGHAHEKIVNVIKDTYGK